MSAEYWKLKEFADILLENLEACIGPQGVKSVLEANEFDAATLEEIGFSEPKLYELGYEV